MNDRERLVLWLKEAREKHDWGDFIIEEQADYLLQHGVTLPPESEEPTPTEMVKALLEKGWTVSLGFEELPQLYFSSPDKKHNPYYLTDAYRSAFPRMKRITVDVWLDESGDVHRVLPDIKVAPFGCLAFSTATFEVPEEE